MRVGVTVANTDDPTASVQIYIPAGYQIGTPAAGTKLGDVTATAAAADLGGAILPLTGELQAVAANPTGAAQCQVAASQYWNLHLTAAGQTLDIPIYVVAANATETASGYQAKLVVCLPPPDVPAGTPGPRAVRREAAVGVVRRLRDHPAGRRPATTAGRRSSRRTTPARARRIPPARSRRSRSATSRRRSS